MKQLEKKIEPANLLLKKYVQLILKWQKAVNLVSNKELDNLWDRHILDSAQLYFKIPSFARVLVDMGSGGGFPAIVIAILNKVLNGHLDKIVLIESDNKKSVFLQEVSRILDLNLLVLNERLENIKDLSADVITSRALGEVEQLLTWGKPLYKKDTVFLFLKGLNVDIELQNVSRETKFEKFNSLISDGGCILKITEVKYE